jgi:hypothetical protein
MMSLWLRPGASCLSPARLAIWKQKKALIGFLGAPAYFLRFCFLSGDATDTCESAAALLFFGAAGAA